MKRKDALRKVRTICQRLDEIDEDTFPIWPNKMYLFGSVLTDKPDPADVDLFLLHRDNPNIKYTEGEILEMFSYKPHLWPHNRAVVALRKGMQMIRIHMLSDIPDMWGYLPLFPKGKGIRFIWKPGLDWRPLIDDIEAHPTPWKGPRTPEEEARIKAEWAALSDEERKRRITEILTVILAQEEAAEGADEVPTP